MEGTRNSVVSVPKTVKSKKLEQSSLINYTTHQKYIEVSCNTDLVNVGELRNRSYQFYLSLKL